VLKVTIEDGSICNHEIIPIADTGADITLDNLEMQSKIKGYSAALKTPYNRPAERIFASPRNSNAPARFSFSWFMRRLNYHFIGAYLKGVKNRFWYRYYFSKYVR
ncbi:hypothetical protein ACFL1J_04640, partial [Pseudomonadota bacterium]